MQQAEGTVYELGLTVRDEISGQQSSSTLSFVTNIPPKGGSFLVVPTQVTHLTLTYTTHSLYYTASKRLILHIYKGTAATTLFTFSFPNWKDPDNDDINYLLYYQVTISISEGSYWH